MTPLFIDLGNCAPNILGASKTGFASARRTHEEAVLLLLMLFCLLAIGTLVYVIRERTS